MDSLSPVVTRTVPEAGSKDVTPGIVEIRVSFSKPMADKQWISVPVWKDSTPDIIGEPRLEADHRTYVVKARLEPNTTYGFWIANQKHKGFDDEQGHHIISYLWVFRTKGL
jgi:hypothetical protein